MNNKLEYLHLWNEDALHRVKENHPRFTAIDVGGFHEFVQDMTLAQWEQLGRDIANNVHVRHVAFHNNALGDIETICLFKGLRGSSSIKFLAVAMNGLSTACVKSMLPFFSNAHNLQKLELQDVNIQSEGFNTIVRILSDKPMESLSFSKCGIESIEIDLAFFPRTLKSLSLSKNKINAEGCKEVSKLLQVRDSTLTELVLRRNEIDDECVSILVDALRDNTSLVRLDLGELSRKSETMLLKLVNDISTIEATLQSNHTLKYFYLESAPYFTDEVIGHYINLATDINIQNESPEAAGREKLIRTQLHCLRRAQLSEIQGVGQSVSSEIEPHLLPEFLSLVGQCHGQGDVFAALKASIAGVISIVNRKQSVKKQLAHCASHLESIKQQLAFYSARSNELSAELEEIEAAEIGEVVDGVEDGPRSFKRTRLY